MSEWLQKGKPPTAEKKRAALPMSKCLLGLPAAWDGDPAEGSEGTSHWRITVADWSPTSLDSAVWKQHHQATGHMSATCTHTRLPWGKGYSGQSWDRMLATGYQTAPSVFRVHDCTTSFLLRVHFAELSCSVEYTNCAFIRWTFATIFCIKLFYKLLNHFGYYKQIHTVLSPPPLHSPCSWLFLCYWPTASLTYFFLTLLLCFLDQQKRCRLKPELVSSLL